MRHRGLRLCLSDKAMTKASASGGWASMRCCEVLQAWSLCVRSIRKYEVWVVLCSFSVIEWGMSEPKKLTEASIEKVLMEVLIRFGLIALLIYLCAHVFSPFTGILLWGLIMAVALYPIHQQLAKRLGGRQGRASTVMILGVMLVFGVPMLMLGKSFGSHLTEVYTHLDAGTLEIEPPSESVAEWPLIRERVYTGWNNLSTDLPKALKRNEVQVKALSKKVLSAALNGAKAMLLLFGAFVIAGVMMAFGRPGIDAIRRVFNRFVGEKGGGALQALCTGTVRSVAVGVLGVALIQAILFGLGFMLIGLKAAGVLSLITLFIGIIQVPALVVAVPVIAYMWMGGDGGTAMNVIFTIYFIIAALSDNVLKPMLLGRGVDAPMPIILIGALGGMVSAGFIGLFIGAVVLAVGYKIFMNWVADHSNQDDSENAAANI